MDCLICNRMKLEWISLVGCPGGLMTNLPTARLRHTGSRLPRSQPTASNDNGEGRSDSAILATRRVTFVVASAIWPWLCAVCHRKIKLAFTAEIGITLLRESSQKVDPVI